MKKTLLTLDKPNKNNRLYSTDVVKKAMEDYAAAGKPILVQSEAATDSKFNVEKAVGKVEDVEFLPNKMVGTVKVFEGKERFAELEVRPSFIGKLSKDGVVTDAELIGFFFTANSA